MKYTPKLPDTSVNVTKKNVLVESGKLLLVLGIIAVVLHFVMNFTLDYVVEHMTPKQEKKLISFINLSPSMEDEKHDAYLQSITDKLAKCANLPYKIETFLIDTPERNAFAMPSGKIYITKGMLKEIENENELINVIGHELGHFKHKDHLKGLGNSLILATMSLFLEGKYGALFGGSLKLSQAKYSQKAEHDADSFGLEVMSCAYGNVASATSLFTRMDDGKKWEYFLETHPAFSSRVAQMKSKIQKEGYVTSAKVNALKQKY